MGVNAITNSLRFQPGDELLTSDMEYNACSNALRVAAERTGAIVVTATIPYPIQSEQEVVDAIMRRVTVRTKLVLLSHVTSPTAVIMPVERIVRELDKRGIDVLVDGAHAPGMLDLNVEALNPTYYVGNFHKFVCCVSLHFILCLCGSHTI